VGERSGREPQLRVLVVEDHELMREAIRMLIRRYRGDELEVVGVAATGDQAMDVLEHVDVDVAVVDIWLVDESGIDVVARMLDYQPALRILYYSGEVDMAIVHEALAVGGHGYVLKAGQIEELPEAVLRVARGGTYIDSRLGPALANLRQPRSLLSARERDVLRLAGDGLTVKESAEHLGIGHPTATEYLATARHKLGARNTTHAVMLARTRGMLAVTARELLAQRTPGRLGSAGSRDQQTA